MTDRTARFSARQGGHLGLAIICVGLFRLYRSMQEGGHGWGDDFALYIDQARGLSDGSLNEVIALNRYAVDNSAYSTFSPYVYPWVFPALLAPLVAWKGIDYSMLKLVPTVCLVVALFFLHRVLRSRIGDIGALVVVLTIGINNFYIGYTDAVLTEHTFLLSVVLTMWWIDKCSYHSTLLAAAATPQVVLGLMLCAAFNTRREGVALLVAVAAAQVAHIVSDRRAGVTPPDRATLVRAVATPYAVFVAGVAAVQLALPGQPFPRYDSAGGSGTQNIWFNLKWYRQPLAEVIGLKDIGPGPLSLLGSEGLANGVFWTFIGAVVLGLVWRVARHARSDAHLAGAFVGIGLLILSPPFREQRYLITLVPFMLYFAFQGANVLHLGLGRVIAAVRRSRVRIGHLAIGALLVCIGTDTWGAYEFHRDYDYVHRGPEDLETQEAFSAVVRFTDGRDVVAFFQARSMKLYTRRRSVQGNSEAMLVERSDWYLQERASDYIQVPLTPERAAVLGFERTWENGRYILWRIPDRYPPLQVPAGIP